MLLSKRLARFSKFAVAELLALLRSEAHLQLQEGLDGAQSRTHTNVAVEVFDRDPSSIFFLLLVRVATRAIVSYSAGRSTLLSHTLLSTLFLQMFELLLLFLCSWAGLVMLWVAHLNLLSERQGGSHWPLNGLRLDVVDSEQAIQPMSVDDYMLRRNPRKIDQLVVMEMHCEGGFGQARIHHRVDERLASDRGLRESHVIGKQEFLGLLDYAFAESHSSDLMDFFVFWIRHELDQFALLFLLTVSSISAHHLIH